ncbi:MAG: caspase family protein [Alphaproteobacteria bacterium]|nr:caspase family protein [Alphaproteobacteria bacterium]
MVRFTALLLCCGLAIFAAEPAAAQSDAPVPERRVALVIGNSAYQHLTRLDNPRNDATAIARQLRESGFEIVNDGPYLDLDKAGMERALQEFGRRLRGANVGMFYFAGHGLQVRARNFLMPVSARIDTETEIPLQALDASLVLEQLEASGARLSIVVLDACRNNPFPGGQFRSMTGGLAQMQAATGTLISFSAQPGALAIDGPSEGNSPYTAALIEKMRTPGLNVLDVFNETGVTVARATSRLQQPWVSNSPIEGRFFFTPVSLATPPPTAMAPGPSQVDPAALELTFWQSIQASRDPAEFEAYLNRYPQGNFAGLARARLQALRATAAAAAAPPAAPTPAPASTPPPAPAQAAAPPPVRPSATPPAPPPAPPPQVAQAPAARAIVPGLCPQTFQGNRNAAGPLVCRCTQELTSGTRVVYGTNIYTDDSSICHAALHAGVINRQGGTVIVRAQGSRPNFQASTRNGFTTTRFGAWPYSFSVALASEADLRAAAEPPRPPAPPAAPAAAPTQQAALPATPSAPPATATPPAATSPPAPPAVVTPPAGAPAPAAPAGPNAGVVAPASPGAKPGIPSAGAAVPEAPAPGASGTRTGTAVARLPTGKSASFPVCPINLEQMRSQTPTRIVCSCTPQLIAFNIAVFGTDVYTDDSGVCNAAIHAGIIDRDGGIVVVTPGAGRQSFAGSARNGVQSRNYGRWQWTYSLSRPSAADVGASAR